MKKKSKLLVIMLALLLTIVHGLSSAYASEASIEPMDDTVMSADADAIIAAHEEKAAVQREAAEAYAVLSETFSAAEDGATIHPDDYAGAWIEGSTLYVALTSLDKDTVAKYDRIFKGFNCVKYEFAMYSLNDLSIVQDAAFSVLNGTYEITAFYTEVETNQIVFEVTDDIKTVQDGLIKMFSTKGFSAKLADGMKNTTPFDAGLFIIKEGERMDTEVSIYGGMRTPIGSSNGAGFSILPAVKAVMNIFIHWLYDFYCSCVRFKASGF